MNKEKQIDEMGEYIAEILHFECGKASCEECKWLGSTNQKADCMDYLVAEKLTAKGYRKASEVAREIIADLVKFADDKERQMSFHGHSVWYIDADDVTDFIAELKKKYTEEVK